MPSDLLSRSSLRIGGYAKIVVATLILAAGIFFGIIGDRFVGIFGLSFLFGLVPLLILISLLLLVGVAALLNKFFCKPPLRKRIGSIVGWLAIIVGSMILSVVLCIVTAISMIRWEFIQVQGYVVKATLVIDAIKAQTGAYPKTLPVDKLGPLDPNLTYRSDGKTCSFLYFDDDGAGIFTYDCGTKTWNYEAEGIPGMVPGIK